MQAECWQPQRLDCFRRLQHSQNLFKFAHMLGIHAFSRVILHPVNPGPQMSRSAEPNPQADAAIDAAELEAWTRCLARAGFCRAALTGCERTTGAQGERGNRVWPRVGVKSAVSIPLHLNGISDFQKLFLTPDPNQWLIPRHPVPREGALAIVTDVGAGSGGRESCD
jgi:hypothetical protein